MPTPYIKKLADKHHTSVSKSESRWEKAKSQAEKQGKGKNFAYITGVYKHMMGEDAKELTLKDFLIVTEADMDHGYNFNDRDEFSDEDEFDDHDEFSDEDEFNDHEEPDGDEDEFGNEPEDDFSDEDEFDDHDDFSDEDEFGHEGHRLDHIVDMDDEGVEDASEYGDDRSPPRGRELRDQLANKMGESLSFSQSLIEKWKQESRTSKSKKGMFSGKPQHSYSKKR